MLVATADLSRPVKIDGSVLILLGAGMSFEGEADCRHTFLVVAHTAASGGSAVAVIVTVRRVRIVVVSSLTSLERYLRV